MNVLWGTRYSDDRDVAYAILSSEIAFPIFSQLSERLRGDIKLAKLACRFYSREIYLNCTDDIREEIGFYICEFDDVIEKSKDSFYRVASL